MSQHTFMQGLRTGSCFYQQATIVLVALYMAVMVPMSWFDNGCWDGLLWSSIAYLAGEGVES